MRLYCWGGGLGDSLVDRGEGCLIIFFSFSLNLSSYLGWLHGLAVGGRWEEGWRGWVDGCDGLHALDVLVMSRRSPMYGMSK